MDYSLIAMFMLVLFGTTTWLLFRDLMNRVEKIERTTDITYEVLVVGEPTSKAVEQQLVEERSNSQEISEWDNS